MAPPLCTLPPGPGPPRFVCFCEGERDGPAGGVHVCVTDGVQLWSTCSAPHGPAAHAGPSAAQDTVALFRAACQQQAVTLTLQEDAAALTLSGVPPALTLDLRKVPAAEAAPRLQALTLGLAERVCSLERRLAAVETAAAPSPRKSPRPAGPGPLLPVRSQRAAWTSRTTEVATSWGLSRVGIGCAQPRLGHLTWSRLGVGLRSHSNGYCPAPPSNKGPLKWRY
ncbi:protein PAXX isoform X2 [Ochotona curzoniae]|uniref:protein PAXX isoform X2 n=1 Tax=Ochotona curzoniae TaxID=130825 RepID=UPI001B34E50E|nr:protein PAXX isoform X2 [Ochotona curzoniae]